MRLTCFNPFDGTQTLKTMTEGVQGNWLGLQSEMKMVVGVQTRYDNWDDGGWFSISDNTCLNGVRFFTGEINCGTNFIKGANNRCFYKVPNCASYMDNGSC